MFFLAQVPVISFNVDLLPMSEAVLAIWASLVQLAGAGLLVETSQTKQISFSENEVEPAPAETTDSAEPSQSKEDVSPTRTLKPPDGIAGKISLQFGLCYSKRTRSSQSPEDPELLSV